MKRITPENITELQPGQVFVFGSNYGGRHSKGAALTALKHYGAVMGVGEGLMGRSYGIPTKPHDVRNRLSLVQIKHHVQVFIDFVRIRPDLTFLVTEIGCGLAGYEPKDIALLFERCIELPNVWLPKRFWGVLEVSDEIICRGCYVLGTACTFCSRCKVERAISERFSEEEIYAAALDVTTKKSSS